MCKHSYIYIYMCTHLYIMARIIRRPLQSSSVLDYSCNPQCLPIQHPQSLPILTHLEASKHPSIPDCRNPSFAHLKGEALSSRRTPQGIHRGFLDADPEPPPTPLGPQIGAPACTGMPNGSFDRQQAPQHPGIRAPRHPGIHSACTGVPNGSFDRQQAPQQPGIRAPRHPGIHASGPEVGGRGGSL